MSFNMEFVERGQFSFYQQLKLHNQQCHAACNSMKRYIGSSDTDLDEMMSLFTIHVSLNGEEATDIANYFKWTVQQYCENSQKQGFTDPVSKSYALYMVFRTALAGQVKFTPAGLQQMEANVERGKAIFHEALLMQADRVREAALRAAGSMKSSVAFALSSFVCGIAKPEDAVSVHAYITKEIFSRSVPNYHPGMCLELNGDAGKNHQNVSYALLYLLQNISRI